MTLAVCPECGGTFAGTDRFCQRDGARLLEADEADPLLGQSVGSYRISALLGAGGMGRVYLGIHPTIGSRVAIKVLSRDSAGRRDLIERFFGEAMVVNRIRHEGIVNVLDLASLPDGRPYIVMELLSGEPLAALFSRLGQLEPSHAVAIALPLLDALAAAHDQGVVHRDLKPDNVFITRQGRVVVLDFGIAKLLPESSSGEGPGRPPSGGGLAMISPSTRTGAVLGTPGYMSPEQVLGRTIGPPADLYAVGVILYQALAGRLPFEAGSAFEMMHKHVSEPAASMLGARPDVPPALDVAVLRALAKDPRERFAGARAMIQALGASLSRGATAPAIEAARPAASERRGSGRGMVAGIAVGGALAAAIVAVALFAARSGEDDGAAGSAVAATGGGPQSPATHDAATPTPTPPASATETAQSIPAAQTPPTETVVAAAPGGGGPAAAADEGATADAGPAAASTARRAPRGGRARATESSGTRVAAAPGKPSGAAEPPTGAAAPSGGGATAAADPSRAGVTQVGGVTIINTAEKARAMTGLEPIAAPLAVRGGAFDPIRTLDQAHAMAKKLMPDAVLVGLDVDHARPDGMALSRSDSGASYRFRSPARSKRPPGAARNEEIDIPCMVHVDAEGGRLVAGAVTDEDCDDRRLARPRCSIAQVWERARAEGAPRSGDWVARVSLLKDGWFIDIPRAGTSGSGDFSLSVPDTCP